MEKVYLRYRTGDYEISVRGNLEQGYINIKAERQNNVVSINNLNYILSNVIAPVIPDWENSQDIVDGASITGSKNQLEAVIKNLWDMRKDPHFLRTLQEDFEIGEEINGFTLLYKEAE